VERVRRECTFPNVASNERRQWDALYPWRAPCANDWWWPRQWGVAWLARRYGAEPVAREGIWGRTRIPRAVAGLGLAYGQVWAMLGRRRTRVGAAISALFGSMRASWTEGSLDARVPSA
jgi:hypothetical protein